ncbi:MAG TPA: hypothetical protein DCZ91_07570 [Lachnospiraceae bacterium]|nr:hypothetical protein [Lachnospiraceae bacterium]
MGWMAIALAGVCMLSAGCSREQEEEADAVLIDHEEETTDYATVKVTRGNVEKTMTLRCVYVQTGEEEISTPASGKKVEEVYVEPGDSVVKGQLLALLSGAGQEDKIRELEHRIARNRLLLEYTDTDEAYELSRRWWDYVYRSSQSEEEKEKLEDSLEEIRQSYQYKREDYQDAIDLDTLELSLQQKALEESCLYAGIDGVITYMYNTNLPVGTNVDGGNVLIRVADNSTCLFEAARASNPDCFREGQVLQLEMDAGSSQTEVDVVPYDMENWGEKIYFAVADEENVDIQAGAGGSMNVTVDSRSQVLTLPKKAVYTAGVKRFVYVQGEDGFPEVRWVGTGLEDDSLIEITGGLSEGEDVIVR